MFIRYFRFGGKKWWWYVIISIEYIFFITISFISAAFLIPYFIMMLVAGLPTFYLELAIGQYASLTPHLLYRKMSPLFTGNTHSDEYNYFVIFGLGYCMIAISIYTSIYYNMIIAWSLYYFGASFQGITGDLPWKSCNHSWNTNCKYFFVKIFTYLFTDCYDDKVAYTCNVTANQFYYKGMCLSTNDSNYSQELYDFSLSLTNNNRTGGGRKTPAQEYK